jgi:hypothetical protein
MGVPVSSAALIGTGLRHVGVDRVRAVLDVAASEGRGNVVGSVS